MYHLFICTKKKNGRSRRSDIGSLNLFSPRTEMAALQHRKRQQHWKQRGECMDDGRRSETRQGQCKKYVGHVAGIEEIHAGKKFRRGSASGWRQAEQ